MSDKVMDVKEFDPDFKYLISEMPGGEHIKKCFACGTCTAGCPVFQVETGYNPRKIIRMILLGMKEELLSSKVIWLCLHCYCCTANCPQDVDFSNIMLSVRNLAIKEGYAPKGLLHKVDEISKVAQEFRKDCINLLIEKGDVDKATVLKKLEENIDQMDMDG
ncbi:MAG: 4Fe-4S dicluster domain-containing protein [Spirochaetales bacterium]|nr:4Fe-4S dicluster domain-containing protein [Spirochaetales bacterium]